MFGLLDWLFPPRSDEARLRALTVDGFLSRLNPVLITDTTPHTTALLSFGDPAVRAAIHEAKYHGNRFAFSLLAAALAEYLRESDHMTRKKTCLVPIPLGKGRRRERGFNQIEEIIIESGTELILEPVLVRTRETISQISLPREARFSNMKDAFSTKRQADPAYTYILIDDVMTTGATLQSAIDALKASGATNIIPIALAH